MRAPLGQHFLKSPSALRSLSQAIPLSKEVFVVEVGPGKGALTAYLLRTGASVLAIERDKTLIDGLQNRFAEEVASGQVRIVAGDVRDQEWMKHLTPPYVIVANIPYYLTSSLLRHLLSSEKQPQAVALMVQKEIAERVVMRDGKASLLSLSVHLFGKPKLLQTVPKTAFSPQPSVASAILTITDIHAPPQHVRDAFFPLIKTAFREKRKQIGKKFAGDTKVLDLLRQHHISAASRAEDIPFSVWYAIAEHMSRTEGRGTIGL